MQPQHHKTILIVDDDPIVRSLFSRYLKSDGYEAIEATSGDEAISMTRKLNLGGILLDLKMPGTDGIEVCQRIRKFAHHKVTPILIITSTEENTALSDAFDAGCDDFIVKPINSIVLRARLKGHIKRTELYYQLERVRKRLNRYISPRTQQMVEQYAGTGRYPSPEMHELCVLFSDIRGFTQLSQQIEPESLITLLSRHLAYQVELVYQYGGYVDKYAGDGIMAVFEGPDMAERSCKCALDIITHAQELVSEKENHYFAVGCGISKGLAVIGNIGSLEHLDYSVVGETVNLAARLCGKAKSMSIIVSDTIYSETKDIAQLHYSTGRDIKVKGFEQAVTIHGLTPA